MRSHDLALGVFNEASTGFVGIQAETGYLFTEFHVEAERQFDTRTLHGTALPYVELERCPVDDLEETHERPLTPDDALPDWLEAAGARESMTKAVNNEPLFRYLEDVERRYDIAALLASAPGPGPFDLDFGGAPEPPHRE